MDMIFYMYSMRCIYALFYWIFSIPDMSILICKTGLRQYCSNTKKLLHHFTV